MTLQGSDFSQKDIKIISEETPFDGFFRVKRYHLQHKRFDGEFSNSIVREVFAREPVAAVLPYDPNRDQVVLIEQVRIGAIHSDTPWLLEIVAGIVEPGETTADMIHREGKEEAGVEFTHVEKIYDFWTSPGGSSEYCSLYLGEVDASKAGGIHGAEHEDEDIKVHVVSAEEAFDAVRDGTINNALTIVALQWLELRKYR